MTTTYININGDVRDASSLTVPADRTFRGAWSFNGDAVEVDMAVRVTSTKRTYVLNVGLAWMRWT